MDINIKSIGLVRSPVKIPVDEGWGEVVSQIELDEEFTEALTGLESFSHVVIVFYMDQNRNKDLKLKRRPRGREDMPEVGILAQRAKHRPNPIGITTVKILSINKNIIEVKGLDAIDGTPVLDIKPFYPAFDTACDALIPEWVTRLMSDYF